MKAIVTSTMNDLGPFMATGKSADTLVNLLRRACQKIQPGNENLVGEMEEAVSNFDECASHDWFRRKKCDINVMTKLIKAKMEPFVQIHRCTKNMDPYDYGNYLKI
jgi:hypothetical protein